MVVVNTIFYKNNKLSGIDFLNYFYKKLNDDLEK